MAIYVELTQEKIADITNNKITSEEELILDLTDLKTRQGDTFFFLIGDKQDYRNARTIELFGSPIKDHLLYLGYHSNAFILTTPRVMLHGTIMNCEDLPYSIDAKNIAIVIKDGSEIEICKSMSEVTEYVEKNMTRTTYITDFDIIIGEELPFDLIYWENMEKGANYPKYAEIGHGLS
jgi:hypothetical protein